MALKLLPGGRGFLGYLRIVVLVLEDVIDSILLFLFLFVSNSVGFFKAFPGIFHEPFPCSVCFVLAVICPTSKMVVLPLLG